jgi:hypothetical protein
MQQIEEFIDLSLVGEMTSSSVQLMKLQIIDTNDLMEQIKKMLNILRIKEHWLLWEKRMNSRKVLMKSSFEKAASLNLLRERVLCLL